MLPTTQYHTPGPYLHQVRLSTLSSAAWFQSPALSSGQGDNHLPGTTDVSVQETEHSQGWSLTVEGTKSCHSSLYQTHLSIPPSPLQHGAPGRDNLSSMEGTKGVSLLPQEEIREAVAHVLDP